MGQRKMGIKRKPIVSELDLLFSGFVWQRNIKSQGLRDRTEVETVQ